MNYGRSLKKKVDKESFLALDISDEEENMHPNEVIRPSAPVQPAKDLLDDFDDFQGDGESDNLTAGNPNGLNHHVDHENPWA